MSPFPLFETIAIINGKPQNLTYHQVRFEQAVRDYLRAEPQWQLEDIIQTPAEFSQGLVRCRIDYNAHDFQIQFFPYTPRKIERLQCVYVENFDYRFKYTDRKRLDLLKKSQNEEIIIVNNGKISDCTIGNLLLLKAGKWYSSEDYLLLGTQLSLLVERGIVTLTSIPVEDVKNYEKVMMINAMNPFKNGQILSISNIIY